MPKISLEICLHATTPDAVFDSSRAAYEGGATTIELCAAMEVGGLTPELGCIEAARRGFGDRAGLMVMVRPHGEGFVYTRADHADQLAQIQVAHSAGADGVVLGPLRADDQVHRADLSELVDAAQSLGLQATFHRAFDLIPDPIAAIDFLIELGVDRILTSGVRWGAPGTALDGVGKIASYARHAGERIQIVVGGGVTPQNASEILARLPVNDANLALHAYSGAQCDGRVTVESVRALIDAANPD